MKTRTQTIAPDLIKAEGSAWGEDLPELVFEEYSDGVCTRRSRVRIRPVDIEDVARALWELRAKYEKAVTDMTACLKGER